jgi:hypothetical protein
MRTTRTPTAPCANCGKPNDAASNPEEDITPKEGDISVCLYCNHVAIFRTDLTLRRPTSAEWDELFKNLTFMRYIQANAELMKRRRK